MAPGSSFGAEFGFIHGDRRHRLVQLHNEEGRLDKLVLIREFREGSDAREEPSLTPSALSGSWSGTASTISAHWPEPDLATCQFNIDVSEGGALTMAESFSRATPAAEGPDVRVTWMADGGYHHTPEGLSHREPFRIEAGWLAGG